jgi:hypothetical protein
VRAEISPRELSSVPPISSASNLIGIDPRPLYHRAAGAGKAGLAGAAATTIMPRGRFFTLCQKKR